jgi:hypothetical protein
LRTSERHGHSQAHNSSAAFDLKSLNPISPRASQGLQFGGTGHDWHQLSPFCGDLPALTPQFPGGTASNLDAGAADKEAGSTTSNMKAMP